MYFTLISDQIITQLLVVYLRDDKETASEGRSLGQEAHNNIMSPVGCAQETVMSALLSETHGRSNVP